MTSCRTIDIPVSPTVQQIVTHIPEVVKVVGEQHSDAEGLTALCINYIRLIPDPRFVNIVLYESRKFGESVDWNTLVLDAIANRWPAEALYDGSIRAYSLTDPSAPERWFSSKLPRTELKRAIVQMAQRLDVRGLTPKGVEILFDNLACERPRLVAVRRVVADLLSRMAVEYGDPEVCLAAVRYGIMRRAWVRDPQIRDRIGQCLQVAFDKIPQEVYSLLQETVAQIPLWDATYPLEQIEVFLQQLCPHTCRFVEEHLCPQSGSDSDPWHRLILVLYMATGELPPTITTELLERITVSPHTHAIRMRCVLTDLLWRALQVSASHPVCQRALPLAYQVAQLKFHPLEYDISGYAYKSWQVTMLYLRHIDEGVAKALPIEEILSTHTAEGLLARIRSVEPHLRDSPTQEIIDLLRTLLSRGAPLRGLELLSSIRTQNSTSSRGDT